jgi:hypothetical protein
LGSLMEALESELNPGSKLRTRPESNRRHGDLQSGIPNFTV